MGETSLFIMGNTLSCFPLSAATENRKTTYVNNAKSSPGNREEHRGCVYLFHSTGSRRKDSPLISSIGEEKPFKEEWFDLTPTSRSVTNVYIRAKNSKRLPRPLKIEENTRYAGQVPILLSEFTTSLPDGCFGNKRAEDGATRGHLENPKRQRVLPRDSPNNIDLSVAVPVADLAYQQGAVEDSQLLRHRSFSVDHEEAILYRLRNWPNAEQGRWRKYLKYSGTVKRYLLPFEYRRNTLDCPSSLERDELVSSCLSGSLKLAEVTSSDESYFEASKCGNKSVRSGYVEQPKMLSRDTANFTKPLSVKYEGDQDDEQLSDESKYISGNLKDAIGSRKPQSVNEVVRLCRHLYRKSSSND